MKVSDFPALFELVYSDPKAWLRFVFFWDILIRVVVTEPTIDAEKFWALSRPAEIFHYSYC